MPSVARVIACRAFMEWGETRADPHAILKSIINEPIKPEDAAFARELFFGSIKWQRKIDFFISHYHKSKTLEKKLNQVLRLGFYQLLQTPNIPAYAVVSETVDLAKRNCGQKQASFVNAVMRSFLREPQKVRLPNAKKEPAGYLGITHSYPDWLVERYLERFGMEQTIKLLAWGNSSPELYFFINSLDEAESDIKKQLTKQNIEFQKSDFIEGYYKCHTPAALFSSELFRRGKIVIGDPAQGLAPALLNPVSGSLTIDLFASPGGKTAALAIKAGRSGNIIAADNSKKRMAVLKNNLQRWRLNNVHPLLCDGLKFASRRKFRYILADVPCSGTGTLRRNSDLRWNLRPEDIKRHAAGQAEYFRAAAQMIEFGGRLVYSTCSLEAEENAEIIAGFLKQNPEYRLVESGEFERLRTKQGMYEILPHEHNTDGAFAAIIERRGETGA